MGNEAKIKEEFDKLKKEYAENFAKFGADSIEFINYEREYDKKVLVLNDWKNDLTKNDK